MKSGAEGSRTPDLLNAIQALSQLSYGPNALPRCDEGATRLAAQPRDVLSYGPNVYDASAVNSPFLRRCRDKH